MKFCISRILYSVLFLNIVHINFLIGELFKSILSLKKFINFINYQWPLKVFIFFVTFSLAFVWLYVYMYVFYFDTYIIFFFFFYVCLSLIRTLSPKIFGRYLSETVNFPNSYEKMFVYICIILGEGAM